MILTLGNLSGRFFWGFVSDIIGRPSTFMIFTSISIPIYMSIPVLVNHINTGWYNQEYSTVQLQ
jgi:hypothetical protein